MEPAQATPGSPQTLPFDADRRATHVVIRQRTPAGGASLDPRHLLRLRTRGRWGVQAGILAGMAVAAIFFVVDLVRMAPFSTPLFLSRSLLQASLALGNEDLIQTLAGVSPGARLAAFTAVHLAVFAILGMLAAALANLFHLPWNSRTGAIAGFLVGSGGWRLALEAGPVWISGANLTPEVFIGTGIVSGAVLGWHLRLCQFDAEEAREGTRAGRR